MPIEDDNIFNPTKMIDVVQQSSSENSNSFIQKDNIDE